ncbi:aminoglycoside phosphotransferase family protein [bacterium]|nr:MAG: aminoglycoside phosphotransferase family protein [bacterium]
MHANEIIINDLLVRQLVREQFPAWANLPLERVVSMGTDNAIYRLGTDMCVRLPRIPSTAAQIEKELHWLPRLVPLLPLAIPEVVGTGKPNADYPFCWVILSWREGENLSSVPAIDMDWVARDLANFLRALQNIEVAEDALPALRGAPLATQDYEMRNALALLQGAIDTEKIMAIWEQCLVAPAWNKPSLLVHGDLLPANLLIQDGRLSLVIDFGLLGVGDPAIDLLPAWSIFSTDTRETFRILLAVDDATWMRGKGWALSIAVIIVPYYQHTNPELVAVAHRMIKEIFADS